jgi:hypothetical protein
MKILIEFNCDNDAFHCGSFHNEVEAVLVQAQAKIRAQMRRKPGAVCTAPESDDVLLDTNGNTIGNVAVIIE